MIIIEQRYQQSIKKIKKLNFQILSIMGFIGEIHIRLLLWVLKNQNLILVSIFILTQCTYFVDFSSTKKQSGCLRDRVFIYRAGGLGLSPAPSTYLTGYNILSTSIYTHFYTYKHIHRREVNYDIESDQMGYIPDLIFKEKKI